jgi:acetyl-CoA carboxylase biotin carboxyl carrier protein
MGADDEVADERLRTLSAEAHRLAGDVKGPLRRIHLRAEDTVVELEWDPGAATVPAAGEPVEVAADSEAAEPEETALVRSPMVGTFYHAPSPGEPPFVSVGDAVRPGTVVGIVEAMKLFNEISADVAGTVREILAPDGEPVEFDQPLFALDPLPADGGEDQ